VRRLKVGCTYQLRVRGKLAPVPFIRLAGRWLESAGFQIGDNVVVEAGEEKLHLVRVNRRAKADFSQK
jgi:hypothetical protein